MQFILASILSVSLLQGTLRAGPYHRSDRHPEASPISRKALYLGGGLGALTRHWICWGLQWIFSSWIRTTVHEHLCFRSELGLLGEFRNNSTPWGTTANSNQYSAQNTWANSNTAYRYPYFNGGFMYA
ncbi:hypothetical protein PSHT_15076 [Puccinia striiformis]|uniref:Uncharacterized protein n=1 Tax=Puccinia striiformis TaxID=27350 RepID=A0A2S4UH19_9BASI|nr:hypothetical protein PSHT_15076 [Puccinia striiformis]